jgi:AcrR family transcriptional regulator
MALTRTPRSSWVEEGLRALAAGGPDAVRIESLAQALGVTEGGFYWHFDDRRMEYMRSLFGACCPDEDDVEARCMLVGSLWIGNDFLAADHGSRSRADVLELALRRLLA